VSHDGQFVAFLSDRDGHTDVWVTQVGSRQFYNLTRGSAPELANPSIRTLWFSPDGSSIAFWVRKHDGSSSGDFGRRQRWAGSRGHTWKASRSSTGRRTAPGSHTTRLDPETRCSYQMAAGGRGAGSSSLRRPGSPLTSQCGRQTRYTSTSFRVPCQTNWTSGASLQPVMRCLALDCVYNGGQPAPMVYRTSIWRGRKAESTNFVT
jgi:hypothetical protein